MRPLWPLAYQPGRGRRGPCADRDADRGSGTREGDAALVRYTNELDRRTVEDAKALRVSSDAIDQALSDLNSKVSSALTRAAARIRGFHERQRTESWQYEDEEGNLLGQRVSALDCVGVYVPGGRASYPSSVLMNAIPAKVAGVERVVMVAPRRRGHQPRGAGSRGAGGCR